MKRPLRSRYIVVLAGTLAVLGCSPDSTLAPASHAPLSPTSRTSIITPADGDTVMRGLNSPRGLAWGHDGALYVAEAGRGGPLVPGPCFVQFGATVCYGATGGVSRLRDGVQERIISDMPSWAQVNSGQGEGPNGISFQGNGIGYVTIGLESNPAALRARDTTWGQFARLARIFPSELSPGRGNPHSGQSWEFVADLGQYEMDVNPDCGDIDSNPFGLLAEPGGVIIADAGANAFVRRAASGEISNFAVFSNNTTVAGPGCPPAATRDFVPTSIITGPDGAYYLGHLNGLPVLPGSSSVLRMESGGTPEVYRTGFTWIVALAFDPSGNLYVLQHSVGPLSNSGGSLVRVTPDGTKQTLITGIQRAGGMVVDDEGRVYISMIEGKNYKADGEVRRYTFAP